MRGRKPVHHGSRGGYSGGSGTAAASTPDYMAVRRYIDAGNLAAAESILNGTRDRSAEWFFLSGMLSYRKGWYDDAVNKLKTANDLAPSNVEYSQAYGRIINMGGMPIRIRLTAEATEGSNDMCCQALQCYICADCCCDAI